VQRRVGPQQRKGIPLAVVVFLVPLAVTLSGRFSVIAASIALWVACIAAIYVAYQYLRRWWFGASILALLAATAGANRWMYLKSADPCAGGRTILEGTTAIRGEVGYEVEDSPCLTIKDGKAIDSKKGFEVKGSAPAK
jgi:hypothetical protein